MTRARATLGVCLVASLLAAVPGCVSLPLPFGLGGRGPSFGFTQEDLRGELDAYATRFGGLVASASEEIAHSSTSSTIDRRAVLWQMRLIPAVREAAFLPDPRQGYVRALTIAVMMDRYFSAGDGKALFGEYQPIAVKTARMLAEDAVAIGARFLAPAELEKVRKDVELLAERFPIQGTNFSLVRAQQAAEAVPQSSALTSVITLPLAPFRALQGVDAGAAAIRDFNRTAERFSSVVATLPEELRGQMQLLLFEAEELRAVRQGIVALELAAASADRASLAFDRLPDELRSILAREIPALLRESQGPAAEAARALAQANELAVPLQATATQLREASALWREILGPRDTASPGPENRPFDIREWEATVNAIGAGAAELRGLATELRGFGASAGLDRLFWRAAALLVLFFALMLVYRVLAARLVRRASSG